jgi:hypothetical protein
MELIKLKIPGEYSLAKSIRILKSFKNWKNIVFDHVILNPKTHSTKEKNTDFQYPYSKKYELTNIDLNTNFDKMKSKIHEDLVITNCDAIEKIESLNNIRNLSLVIRKVSNIEWISKMNSLRSLTIHLKDDIKNALITIPENVEILNLTNCHFTLKQQNNIQSLTVINCRMVNNNTTTTVIDKLICENSSLNILELLAYKSCVIKRSHMPSKISDQCEVLKLDNVKSYIVNERIRGNERVINMINFAIFPPRLVNIEFCNCSIKQLNPNNLHANLSVFTNLTSVTFNNVKNANQFAFVYSLLIPQHILFTDLTSQDDDLTFDLNDL